MPCYEHHFIAKGTGNFPIDMLRYDRAMPWQSHDAGNIELSVRDINVESWEIRLVHMGPDRLWLPTVGRWESFTWRVFEVDTFGHKGEMMFRTDKPMKGEKR